MSVAKSDAPVSFEEALARLETIVRELEDGRLGLTDSLARYEEGVKHLKLCYQSLQQAERKIELLTGLDANGNAVTQPFDDEELTIEEKAQARPRRRSKSAAAPAAEMGKDAGGDVMDSGRTLF